VSRSFGDESIARRWLSENPWWRRAIAAVDDAGCADAPVYIVGGTVRDALLGRPSCDLDLAVGGAPGAHNAMALARRLANALGGAYVPLDAERDVGRIVLDSGGEHRHIDVAALRPNVQGTEWPLCHPPISDIEADLRARDLTINAMAWPLVQVPGTSEGARHLSLGIGPLLDPLGGEADLRAGLLRAASPLAFQDDPLRILRVIRLRGALGFSVTHETKALMIAALPRLSWGDDARISAERLRDELLQILALDAAADALAYGADLGIWDMVMPEVAAPMQGDGGGLDTLRTWEACFGPLLRQEADQTGEVAAIVAALEPYLSDLLAHWCEELCDQRPRWWSTKLAALLISTLPPGPKAPWSIAGNLGRRLRLSTREVRHLEGVVRATLDLWPMLAEIPVAQISTASARLALYRYCREAGVDGIDGALLRLAQDVASGPTPHLAIVVQLLEAWFRRHEEWVDPSPLLSGGEIMQALELAPGPRIGELIERLREAQVQGLIRTTDEAHAYLQEIADA
jgi:tRNA nucleotidyltransferase/poly(A) polymerase